MLRLAQRLWRTLTKRQRTHVSLLVVAVIVMAVLEVVNVSAIAPFLSLAADPTMIEENTILSYLYNMFRFESTSSFLIAVGLGVFGLMLLSNAWTAITTWAQLRLVWSWNHQLSVRLLKRYLYRPYSYFLSRNTADLSKNLLTEVQQVTRDMLRYVVLGLGKAFVALGIVAVLIVSNPMLALIVTVVVGGSYSFIYATVRKRLRRIGRKRVHANEQRFTVAGEALGGIKDVKILNVEEAFLQQFDQPSYEFSRYQAANQVIGSVPRYAIETVAFGTIILIVVYLISVQGDLDGIIPALGLYAFAGYRLMPALQQIFQGITQARFNAAALDAILNDLETEYEDEVPVPAHNRSEHDVLTVQDKIELKDVRFTYPTGERPALDGIHMTIKANTTVGFVGATGSGKTTLADVILGLLRPQEGTIAVDGVAVTDENVTAWQHNLGYVPQHIFLTDATVAENIAFGVHKEDIDYDAVRKAAQIAQIDDFIMQDMPQQYDTVVGERGIRLSGGQRQRIGIARALYRDPDVLVFDEATSALDNTTEDNVMEALKTLLGKKTVIIIAHRLTTLEDCDEIYVLDSAKVVSQVHYSELYANEDGIAPLAVDVSE